MTGQTLDSRGMEALNEIPLVGFVNDIAVGPKARFCVVASGQEPRLGRWNRIAKAKNRFGIIRLRSGEDNEENESEDAGDSSEEASAVSSSEDSASEEESE